MTRRSAIDHLRVVSYNVHGCVGTDGRFSPGRIVEVLDQLSPDIVGLQEIDTRRGSRHDVDVVEELRRGTGMRAVLGATLETDEGRYGNALLTNLPIHDVTHHDVSVPGREPRAVLDAELGLTPGRLRFLVTHFGLSRRERRQQFGLVHQLLEEDGDASATILVGDMNAWRPWPAELRAMDEMLGETPRLRTYPSYLPLLKLDKIWMSPRAQLRHVEAHRSAEARRASDHLPLLGIAEV